MILSIGSINADFQMRVDATPGGADTLLARDFIRSSGGKAANTAYIGRRYGHVSRLFGRVGDDDLAGQALSPLAAIGVDLAGVGRATGVATAVSMIEVATDGSKHAALALNANDTWDETSLAVLRGNLDEAMQAGAAVLVLDFEIAPRAVSAVLDVYRRRRDNGHRLVLDASPTQRLSGPVLDYALRGADAIAVNEEALATLTGFRGRDMRSMSAAARALRARGVRLACIKRADGGCIAQFDDGANGRVRTLCVPAASVTEVDRTGADDAFAGVLAVALHERLDADEAVILATAASRHAVTVYGSQASYVDRAALAPLVERLRRNAYDLDG
ncbi:carbohydrate kinase family protein [Chitinasiproducens palmae]|uniref:Ribokinase n=1 Tax=Chitinasiproducens palmae TaxID=1770053 RepID=A0A1H2PIP2_9BURK|nr:PfkB family carbohydrate kinase [Chitinasiproducens palmae]SDV46163.1 ribokinase [Chitinasiproducens palmae]